jgi:hypothetical protein
VQEAALRRGRAGVAFCLSGRAAGGGCQQALLQLHHRHCRWPCLQQTWRRACSWQSWPWVRRVQRAGTQQLNPCAWRVLHRQCHPCRRLQCCCQMLLPRWCPCPAVLASSSWTAACRLSLHRPGLAWGWHHRLLCCTAQSHRRAACAAGVLALV